MMRKTSPQSDKKQSKTVRGGLAKSRLWGEWPLLIYPALFLTTLAILYGVNRSIEKGPRTPLQSQRTAQGRAATPSHAAEGAADSSSTSATVPAPRSGQSAEAGGTASDQAQTPQDDGIAGKTDRAPSIVGKMQHAVDLSQLKGAARTVALLCVAVDEKDNGLIKQCLAELEAMGDAAVIPLQELMVREEGEAALWAATALARIGTPMAAGTLLDRLAQTTDGVYKEELGKRVSTIGNHDSWPLLLDTMMQANDTGVVRAAGAALSRMADAPVVDELIARYDSATTAAEAERIAQLVRNIQSPKATESLLSLAGSSSTAPQDSLQQAAIQALAKVGDAPSVNYLLQRLEASPPGESGQIFNAITQIDSPEGQASLLYAAAGNKEVSAEHGQAAAICALKNYPSEQTVALLERILAQEQNEKVLTAATRTLDGIYRSGYPVTAKADSLLKSEQMLPLRPIEK